MPLNIRGLDKLASSSKRSADHRICGPRPFGAAGSNDSPRWVAGAAEKPQTATPAVCAARLQFSQDFIVLYRGDFNNHGHSAQSRAVDYTGRENQHTAFFQPYLLNW
jgi:hypothetical protein